MYSRDVETYMSYCDRKGLAQRTLHSYDQTLRMFGMYLETIGIKNTEDIRHVDIEQSGLYPTVNVRQLMWALRMKPMRKERWETVFDRKDI